jgi:predicted nucleotidyltransferase
MKLSDFKDNTDAALEEYQLLRANAWEKKDTDRIMKIFQEIQHDKTNTARMVIKDPISSF